MILIPESWCDVVKLHGHLGIAGSNQLKLLKYLQFSFAMKRVSQTRDEDDQIQSFSETLEERARKVFAVEDRQIGKVSRSSFIEDDIALTLHQIDRLRARDRDIRQSLVQAECYINTELIQMEERTPRYSPYRFPEREKLQRRLSRIAEERRRFVISQAEKLDAFHERLLSLLNKHRQLKKT